MKFCYLDKLGLVAPTPLKCNLELTETRLSIIISSMICSDPIYLSKLGSKLGMVGAIDLLTVPFFVIFCF